MEITQDMPTLPIDLQDSVLLNSPNIGQISEALSKAQSEIKLSEKDAVNPHFRSAYSTLSSSMKAAKEATSKYGLAIIQAADFKGGLVTVVTLLSHKSEQWFKNILRLPVAKTDIHSIKSAVTYGRRIGYDGLLGIAPTDDSEDDGNAGSTHPNTEDIVNQKEAKKLRAKMNKAFQACKKMPELEKKAKELKGTEYGFWDKPTYHGNGETFGNLYLTHKDRIGSDEARHSEEGHADWRDMLGKVDAGNFHNMLDHYRKDADRQTTENELALQVRAQELGLWDEHNQSFMELEAE